MRAAVVSAFAASVEGVPASVSVVADRAMPEVKGSDVLVEVHAASLNPVDYKILLGNLAPVPSLPKVPFVPGFDLSGTVVAVGPKCSGRLRVGDRVMGAAGVRQGALAQFAAVSEQNLAQKPPGMTFAEAASLPVVALTAWQALRDRGDMKPGQRVLVLGGSGGVGSAAVQLAKALGASQVVATCSAANADLVRGLNADRVIDYRTEDWAAALGPSSIDLVVDAVGGAESWEKCPAVLSKPGAYVTVAGDEQGRVSFGRVASTVASVVNRKFWSVFGGPRYDYFQADLGRFDEMDEVSRLVTEGRFRAVVERCYPLDQVADAYQHVMGGRTKGKIVVEISEKAHSRL